MMIYRFPGSSALRASTPGLKDDDPSGATPLRDRQAGSSLSESGSEAPRQGCSVFSPGVEEGRKPRRRPRDRSAGKNPLDPARGRTIKPTRGVRHPGGVVYLLCIFVSRGRRSYAPPTPGLKDDDPSGATPLRDRVEPLVGARSIGIGHPRSGDQCTAPPADGTPAGVQCS